MSLTTRLLLFALAALAVVLIGFSITLYALASGYIHWQAQERVALASNTLVASVDIEPDSVEWEPSDRDVKLGTGPLGEPVHWFITDASGRPVDHSPQPGTEDLMAEVRGDPLRATPTGSHWLVVRRLVHPPGKAGEQLIRERTPEEIVKGEHPALIFTVGMRLDRADRALWMLAAGLACLSAVVWLVGVAAGRRVCRWALHPLTEMANAARCMSVKDFAGRLKPPGVSGELDDLHAAINGVLDRLQEVFERERRFTSEASHQLRTPLATILGQIEVAIRRPRTPEEYERTLKVIHRQAAHLAKTVEGLMFLARATARGSPALGRIDLAVSMSELLESLAQHPRHPDLILTIDPAPGGPIWVDAHPALLRELAHNLVDNALKYSPPGTPVTVRLFPESGGATLVVEDHGTGVPADDLPHLFEPFFRSSAARGVSGSGLGLAVAARIVVAFGARIEAVSQPGEGTRITVSFPRPASDLLPT
jgi:signal transduction histidine kinase